MSSSRANQALRSLANAGFQNRGVCLQAFPSFPSPSPLFHFLPLASFLARPKPRISFLGLSLLLNSTETLATQANHRSFHQLNMSNQSLPALGTDPPFSHKIVVSIMHEQNIICSKRIICRQLFAGHVVSSNKYPVFCGKVSSYAFSPAWTAHRKTTVC